MNHLAPRSRCAHHGRRAGRCSTTRRASGCAPRSRARKLVDFEGRRAGSTPSRTWRPSRQDDRRRASGLRSPPARWTRASGSAFSVSAPSSPTAIAARIDVASATRLRGRSHRIATLENVAVCRRLARGGDDGIAEASVPHPSIALGDELASRSTERSTSPRPSSCCWTAGVEGRSTACALEAARSSTGMVDDGRCEAAIRCSITCARSWALRARAPGVLGTVDLRR